MELNSFKNNLYTAIAVALFVGWLALFWVAPSLALWVVILMSCVSMFTLAFYFFADSMVPAPVPKKPAKWPSVSVVMPSYNSISSIKEALEAVTALEYPGKLEVIVMDDSSTDGSYEYAKSVKGVKVIRRTGKRGKAAALNEGIAAAKGEIVACIDSDTYPQKDALTKMVPYFYTDRNVGAVTAYIVVAHPKNIVQRMQELEYFNSFGFVAKTMSKVNGLMVTPGPMSIYRKSALTKLGGFDEDNMTEDMEIGLRLQENGYVIECASEAVVPTEVPDTLVKLYRQRVRWYRGTLFNLRKYAHMLFNQKYSDFGVFSFPSTSIYVVFTLCLAGVLFYNLANTLGEGSLLFLSWLKTSQLQEFRPGGIMFSSISLFLLISFVAWLFFVFKSVKMAGAKLGLRHVIPAICLIVLYPAMITFFYVRSLFKEVRGSKFTWQ